MRGNSETLSTSEFPAAVIAALTRFAADRRSYKRAQNEVKTSVKSRTRSSFNSARSTTISRRLDAARGD